MASWWTELWSFGRGNSRLYCGIARTEEGFAVDLFRGDTCIDSALYATRSDATEGAHALKTRYQAREVPPDADPWPRFVLDAAAMGCSGCDSYIMLETKQQR
jgi:hypothetical protein